MVLTWVLSVVLLMASCKPVPCPTPPVWNHIWHLITPLPLPFYLLSLLSPSCVSAPPLLTLQKASFPICPLNLTHRGRWVPLNPLFPWQPVRRSLLLQAALVQNLSTPPPSEPRPAELGEVGKESREWREVRPGLLIPPLPPFCLFVFFFAFPL